MSNAATCRGVLYSSAPAILLLQASWRFERRRRVVSAAERQQVSRPCKEVKRGSPFATFKTTGVTPCAKKAGTELPATLISVDTATTDAIQPIQPQGGRTGRGGGRAWPSPPGAVSGAMSEPVVVRGTVLAG